MEENKNTAIEAADEIGAGERFAFGANWSAFLGSLNDERISEAENDLKKMLECETLAGKKFLDAGCGSGIHSLAAARLGAEVFSFDYDRQSVECARELKRRFEPSDRWQIAQGSVLDREFLGTLGEFDIVYSWGVLHHTGAMYEAMANIVPLARGEGVIFISIYNDQRWKSKVWRAVKRLYNSSPKILKPLIVGACYIRLWGPRTIIDILRLKPFYTWRNYAKSRGMSPHYDVIDWVGGYPFEVAKPEQIFEFYRDRGFILRQLFTCGDGIGCNQFVFVKAD